MIVGGIRNAEVARSSAMSWSTSAASTRRTKMFVPPCRKTGMASNWKFPMWNSGPELRKTLVWSACGDPGGRHAHRQQVAVGQHRAVGAVDDGRRVDDQEGCVDRHVDVDVRGTGRQHGVLEAALPLAVDLEPGRADACVVARACATASPISSSCQTTSSGSEVLDDEAQLVRRTAAS